MIGARHVAGAVVVAFVALGTACSLLYAGYDDHFGGSSEGGVAPFFAGDGGAIEGLAANTQGVFFYVSAGATNESAIRQIAIDGGGGGVWWSGDASVSAIASDGADQVAWIAGGTLYAAKVAAPNAAVTVTTGLGSTASATLAADATRIAWLGAVVGAKCPPGGCNVANLAPWSGTPNVALDLATDAGNVSPHAVAVAEPGITVAFDAVGSTEHFITHFGSDGGATCTGAETSILAMASPIGKTMFAIQGTNVVLFDTTASDCPGAGSTVGTQGFALATDGTRAYWINKDGSVFTIAAGETNAATLGAIAGTPARAIALDSSFVYVASGASIFRVSKFAGD